MKYIIDIDGTICTPSRDSNYVYAQPYYDRIAKINQLYDAGHYITYWTARGQSTGRDWTELTRTQLRQWGVKHHALEMRKPSYDVWVDDKAHNSEDFFK